MDDSGFSEDTRQSSKVTGNICIVVKGRWTVTGACGPYNLGGSATLMQHGTPLLPPIAIAEKSFKSIETPKPAQCKAAELIIFNIPLV